MAVYRLVNHRPLEFPACTRALHASNNKGQTWKRVYFYGSRCWPESNRKPRKARWTFLGELVHMRIVQFPSGNSLAVIRFRRCGREFSMRTVLSLPLFSLRGWGRGGRSKRREIIGRFLEKSVFSLSNLLQEMDEWPAIMREI